MTPISQSLAHLAPKITSSGNDSAIDTSRLVQRLCNEDSWRKHCQGYLSSDWWCSRVKHPPSINTFLVVHIVLVITTKKLELAYIAVRTIGHEKAPATQRKFTSTFS